MARITMVGMNVNPDTAEQIRAYLIEAADKNKTCQGYEVWRFKTSDNHYLLFKGTLRRTPTNS
jgi:hypothetical protein